MGKLIDLTGRKINKWTVLSKGPFLNGTLFWLCKCECGTEKLVRGETLRAGTTRGCIKCRKQTSEKHGMSRTRLYRIWMNMRRRCIDPKSPSYKNYGAKGIRVCDEWNRSFETFMDWAMASGYDESLTIDRINNSGNYEPSNCRWATTKEQSRNKSNNHILTHNGRTMLLSDWADELNVKPNTICGRLKRMSVDEALSM